MIEVAEQEDPALQDAKERARAGSHCVKKSRREGGGQKITPDGWAVLARPVYAGIQAHRTNRGISPEKVEQFPVKDSRIASKQCLREACVPIQSRPIWERFASHP
jgi:hypothetical protein